MMDPVRNDQLLDPATQKKGPASKTPSAVKPSKHRLRAIWKKLTSRFSA